MNVIARLEYELAFYDSAVHRFNHYTTWTPPSMRLVSVHEVLAYSSMDTTAAWKKLRFILSDRSDFHMTDSLSITDHAFASRVLMSLSVDDTLLPKLVNLSSSFKEPPVRVEISFHWFWFWLKHTYSILSVMTGRSIPPPVSSRQASRRLAWGGCIFLKRYVISVVCVP